MMVSDGCFLSSVIKFSVPICFIIRPVVSAGTAYSCIGSLSPARSCCFCVSLLRGIQCLSDLVWRGLGVFLCKFAVRKLVFECTYLARFGCVFV